MTTAIVDYGMGNLHSVLKSVQAAAAANGSAQPVLLTGKADDIRAAERIVFPGQGAMPDCMAALHHSGLGEALAEAFAEKPFFGICVGAQLLFEHSEEGDTAGLGWFSGTVKRFPANHTDRSGNRLKVPHMGWNTVDLVRPHPLFEGIAPSEYFYFVHSYYFEPQDREIVLGQCDYTHRFACIVGRDNVFATQFHTEKSHHAGLKLLQNFLNWRP